jgi:tRNA pseudouridine55 synthase
VDQPATLSRVHGVLVLDKPEGLSSALAVDRVKHALRVKRAGHGGTLDPMATGVLAVCIGEATKLASYLLADDKQYIAEGHLGVETDTLDRTGVVTQRRDVHVTREALLAAIALRMGEQDQVPPMYSAIKQDGVRLYRLARAGEEVERAARKIRVDRLELTAFEPPRFTLEIACSKGTYVRSLVADLGTDVGAGAHLTALRRTRSGRFSLAQATTLDQVEHAVLVPLTAATDLPMITIPVDKERHARNGVQFTLAQLGAENLTQFQMLDPAGALLAIVHAEDGHVVYDRVFHPVTSA